MRARRSVAEIRRILRGIACVHRRMKSVACGCGRKACYLECPDCGLTWWLCEGVFG